jgi:hypothetical protein
MLKTKIGIIIKIKGSRTVASGREVVNTGNIIRQNWIQNETKEWKRMMQYDIMKSNCPLSVVGLRRKRCPVTLDCDGMGSIPAIPKARTVPLLLCHELFKKASLPEKYLEVLKLPTNLSDKSDLSSVF